MTDFLKNPKVDFFFEDLDKWHLEYNLLRDIIFKSNLEKEELKWRKPCYLADNKNIVLIHGFKEYCALLFFKGSLMKDPKNILIQQTENVQAARQIRFSNKDDIIKNEKNIISYINHAIEIEQSGIKVEYKKVTDFEIPIEFKEKLDEDLNLKNAFESLTPGRQKSYILFFSSAKQEKTRQARIAKYINKILEGKGMDD